MQQPYIEVKEKGSKPYSEIALKFNLSKATIMRICNRKGIYEKQ